jgi:Gpi18-like mannosyltransferase
MPKRALFSSSFLVIVIVALFLRIILIANPGFEADISFWKSWGLATVDFGIVEGMKVTNNNYPTPFAYTLGGMVLLYKLFADPHHFQSFWSNTNLLFLAIAKLFPILADSGIAAIILMLGRRPTKFGMPELPKTVAGLSGYELLAAIALLSPVALIDGAWWGQVDSLGLVIFLTAVIFALTKRPFLAGMVFMLSMMTKLQNMIYGPVFFLFLWQSGGMRALTQSFLGAATGFIGLNAEFFLTKNADRVFASLTENYDYFPWMSLMAYNLWWIVSGARGLATSDKYTVLGMVNAKTVGLLLFSSLYGMASLRQLLENTVMTAKSNGTPLLRRFIESLILINGAFFLFQTQSHDRYAYPIAIFLLLWAPFYVTDMKGKFSAFRARLFGIGYGLFTLFYFYNLHTALVVNYPKNGIPGLSLITQPVFTITTAFFLLGLYAWFVASLITDRHTRIAAGVAIIFLGGALAALNLPLLTKKPVPLTSYVPFVSEQAYGTRQTNKAVQSSFGGPYQWTRLSVQYLFYEKGIGTHANSKHTFHINKKFQTFTTDMGIDTEAGTKASAVFSIYGDGKLLFRSDVMRRFDLPRHASVDVTGVTNLTLETTDAGDGNYDDHTDWLNPQLIP